jgi:hypothetical protein
MRRSPRFDESSSRIHASPMPETVRAIPDRPTMLFAAETAHTLGDERAATSACATRDRARCGGHAARFEELGLPDDNGSTHFRLDSEKPCHEFSALDSQRADSPTAF